MVGFWGVVFVLVPMDCVFGQVEPVDALATSETRSLYVSLAAFSRDRLLFGHQDDLAYGVMSRVYGASERSDVKLVCGAYPAVFGWDIGQLEMGFRRSLDRVSFSDMRAWIRDAYEMGGINTVSWHAGNPVGGGSPWDTRRAVDQILPGGAKHEVYIVWLDRLGAFFSSLRGPEGEPIPIIFRPFHEHTGDWFWWGAAYCTKDEFVRLWRFTVEYLRDRREVHNLLYAYSPHDVRDRTHYLERYPGDGYVDVLGVDYYYWGEINRRNFPDYVDRLVKNCRIPANLAAERGKLAALTETGREGLDISNWFTEGLLNPLRDRGLMSEIAYALVWRNADTGHHFAPYEGHSSVPDFLAFYEDEDTVFIDGLPDLYDGSIEYVGADRTAAGPESYSLFQNAPNPFNAFTTISFYVPEDVRGMSIDVFNAKGQHVQRLIGGFSSQGYHRIVWSASHLPSGTYLVRMQVNDEILSRKAVLVR